MKEYLIAGLRFNDYANRKVLIKIKELLDRIQAIKLFSHLIETQNKMVSAC